MGSLAFVFFSIRSRTVMSPVYNSTQRLHSKIHCNVTWWSLESQVELPHKDPHRSAYAKVGKLDNFNDIHTLGTFAPKHCSSRHFKRQWLRPFRS